MLQVARLAPNLLSDSSQSVVQFIESQLHDEGGFVDRAGEPDLYYCVFGIDDLIALQAPLPSQKLLGYLQSVGDGERLTNTSSSRRRNTSRSTGVVSRKLTVGTRIIINRRRRRSIVSAVHGSAEKLIITAA